MRHIEEHLSYLADKVSLATDIRDMPLGVAFYLRRAAETISDARTTVRQLRDKIDEAEKQSPTWTVHRPTVPGRYWKRYATGHIDVGYVDPSGVHDGAEAWAGPLTPPADSPSGPSR